MDQCAILDRISQDIGDLHVERVADGLGVRTGVGIAIGLDENFIFSHQACRVQLAR